MGPASHLHEDVDALLLRITELENALEASQLRQQWQLDLAAQIHRSLLPTPVRHERMSVDVRYLPIDEVGGDYSQVRFPDFNTCYVTMCDVTSHGVGAALLATRVNSEVRHAILARQEPSEIVQMLNEFLDDFFSEAYLYLTFFAAKIDLAEGRVTYSGAGHPSPLLLRRANREVEPLASQNPIVGVMRDALDDEPEHTVDVEPGDRLIFYTDGITETENEDSKQLGVVGLAQIGLETFEYDLFDTLDEILRRITAYQSGPDTDDKTLLVAEFR